MDGGGQVGLVSVCGSCRSCSFRDSVINGSSWGRVGKWDSKNGWQRRDLLRSVFHGRIRGQTAMGEMFRFCFGLFWKGNSDHFFKWPTSLGPFLSERAGRLFLETFDFDTTRKDKLAEDAWEKSAVPLKVDSGLIVALFHFVSSFLFKKYIL